MPLDTTLVADFFTYQELGSETSLEPHWRTTACKGTECILMGLVLSSTTGTIVALMLAATLRYLERALFRGPSTWARKKYSTRSGPIIPKYEHKTISQHNAHISNFLSSSLQRLRSKFTSYLATGTQNSNSCTVLLKPYTDEQVAHQFKMTSR